MASRNCGWELVAVLLTLTLALINLSEANSDVDALYALRQSLSDPDHALDSWDPSLVNPCTWFHVVCNGDNRVTRVDLPQSNLSGHLPPELGNLEFLEYLELHTNNIQGTVPSELGNLKSLRSMDLFNNKLTGQIPPSFGKLKSLLFLRINNNRFTGPIPTQLTEIPNLRVVDVSNNDLCGTVPTGGSFAHIPSLFYKNNPRLKGPQVRGLPNYDTNCT